MQKRSKFITLGVALCVVVLFVGVDVKIGCACIVQDEMVLREARNLIAETKTSSGAYPTHDEVSSAVQFGTVHKYENVRPESGGIYYAINSSTDEFVLKRYADVNFFGIKTPFVWEVE